MQNDSALSVPAVSIIVPAYNAEKHVAGSIKSVLGQTFHDFELIIVDDGSTDGTADIVKSYLYDRRIAYFYQSHGGPSRARNTGIKKARGKYVSFLDSDDLWLSEKLEKQLSYFQQHPDTNVIFTDFEIREGMKTAVPSFLGIKNHYKEILEQKEHVKEAFLFLLDEMFMFPSTLILERECFENIGMFDELLIGDEDVDFALRLAIHYKIAYIPNVLVHKMRHDSNLSHQRNRSNLATFHIFKKLYDRSYAIIQPHLDYFCDMYSKKALTAGRLYLDMLKMKEARSCMSISLRKKPRLRPLLFFLITFVPSFLVSSMLENKELLKRLLALRHKP